MVKIKKVFKNHSGKITFLMIFLGLIAIATLFIFNLPSTDIPRLKADVATTSVTVLNTPPSWTVDAQESPESSTSSPTNVGTSTGWIATATDPNGQDYWLLICKTSATPTPGVPPECAGGSENRWARSATTSSGAQAYASRVALDSDNEANDWYAWICDYDDPGGNHRCNATYKQGSGNTASPFVVNHRPNFTAFVDNSPREPGQIVTWYASSTDPDTYGGQDTVKLFVCKANDFTGTACGAGGTYCSSSWVTNDPYCSFEIDIPTQDKDYPAYGYIVDEHYFAASSSYQGSDSVLTVSNVAPFIASSTISLINWSGNPSDNLQLTTLEGETTGFIVQMTVTDYNSCSSTSGYEISTTSINVFMSTISCELSGDYNANQCYPDAYAGWNPNYVASSTTCSGPTDSDMIWTATFPLQYHANPTVGSGISDSPWWDKIWLASARAIDNNGATSSWTTAQTGKEMDKTLGYSVLTETINYGSLEPGQANDPIDKTTVMKATGNVGMNEELEGTDMCTPAYWPACNGGATSTIYVNNQRYASSSVAYNSGIQLTGTSTEFAIRNPKTTITASPATSTTWWGIRIPNEITLSGSYQGQNTIVAVTSDGQFW